MTAAATPAPKNIPIFRILTVFCLSVVSVNAFLIVWLVVRQAENDAVEAATHELASEALLVRDLLRASPLDAGTLRPFLVRTAQHSGSRITLVAADGSIAADTVADADVMNAQPPRPEIQQALAGRRATLIGWSAIMGRNEIYVAVPADGEPGGFVVRTSVPVDHVRAQGATIQRAALVATGGSGLAALVVLLLFARTLDRRVNQAFAHSRSSEERTRQSEAILSTAEQVAGLGSWQWDIRTNAVHWSAQQFRLFGLDPGSRAPSFDLFLEFVHPEDRGAVQQQVWQAVEGRTGFTYDYRAVRVDGVIRLCHAVGTLEVDAEGQPLRMIGTSQDVTELRATEALRRSRDEEFRAFVETTREWVWSMDARGILTYCNAAVLDILGYAPANLIGTSILGLLHPDDLARTERELASLMQSKSGWSGWILRWCHRNGTYRHLESSATPILDAAGNVIGYRGVDRDVTERVEAARMKSDFVSFVSHQLRTPLSGIKWMLELAADSDGLAEAPRSYIHDAQASADRLGQLVNDLLDIARLESGRVQLQAERLALDALTRSVAAEFETVTRDKGLQLTLELAPDTVVRADPQMVRQVVMNLLSNALKYTPAGGVVAVRLEHAGQTVRWSITDNGVGIPKLAQSRLFEKFFRADNALTLETEGTGLGLHLVRLIVESSGGRVWCDSEEGQGATFTFTLPAEQEVTA